MDKQPQNPPAFPHAKKFPDGTHNGTHSGMSLRDYFAGLAMAAMAAEVTNAAHKRGASPEVGALALAITAFEIADAMLKARTT